MRFDKVLQEEPLKMAWLKRTKELKKYMQNYEKW